MVESYFVGYYRCIRRLYTSFSAVEVFLCGDKLPGVSFSSRNLRLVSFPCLEWLDGQAVPGSVGVIFHEWFVSISTWSNPLRGEVITSGSNIRWPWIIKLFIRSGVTLFSWRREFGHFKGYCHQWSIDRHNLRTEMPATKATYFLAWYYGLVVDSDRR